MSNIQEANLFSQRQGTYQLHPLYVSLRRLLPGRRVLELDCGSGEGAAFLAQGLAEEVVGLEPDPVQVSLAAQRHHRAGLSFSLLEGEDSLPFEDGSFDLVLAVRQGFDPFRTALVKDVMRVLGPAGLFVAALPNPLRASLPIPASHDTLDAAPITPHQRGLELHRTFPQVRLLAQSPLIGYLFHDLAQPEATLRTLQVDPLLVEGRLDEIHTWLALCSRVPEPAQPPTLVRLPFDDLVRVLQEEAELGQERARSLLPEEVRLQGFQERLVEIHQTFGQGEDKATLALRSPDELRAVSVRTATATGEPPVTPVVGLDAELESFRQTLLARETQIEELKLALAARDESEQRLREQLARQAGLDGLLAETRAQAHEEAQLLRAQLSEAEEQRQSLEARLQEATDQAAAAEQTGADLHEQLELLQGHLAALAPLAAEVEELREQVAAAAPLAAEVEELREQVAAAASLAAEVEELREQVAAAAPLAAEVEQLREQVAAADPSAAEELVQLRGHLEALAPLASEHEQLSAQVAIQTEQIQEQEERILELESETGLLQAQLAEREQQAAGRLAAATQQDRQLDDLQRQLAEQTQQLEASAVAQAGLVEELAELRRRGAEAEAELAILQPEAAAAAALRSELAVQEQTVASLQADFETAAEEIVLLRGQLDELTAQLEAATAAAQQSRLELQELEVAQARLHEQERELVTLRRQLEEVSQEHRALLTELDRGLTDRVQEIRGLEQQILLEKDSSAALERHATSVEILARRQQEEIEQLRSVAEENLSKSASAQGTVSKLIKVIKARDRRIATLEERLSSTAVSLEQSRGRLAELERAGGSISGGGDPAVQERLELENERLREQLGEARHYLAENERLAAEANERLLAERALREQTAFALEDRLAQLEESLAGSQERVEQVVAWLEGAFQQVARLQEASGG